MTQTEFEHLLLQTRDKMMRVAMSFFHNREDAEDVVQEVCMRMLERGWKPCRPNLYKKNRKKHWSKPSTNCPLPSKGSSE